MKPLAFTRYGVVSLVCLVTHNIIMIAGDALGQTIVVAVTESFALVGAIGYLLHSGYTFEAPRTWLGFLRYSAAMAANLPVSVATIWIFARLLGWPMIFAAPAAAATMVAANFFASRWAIASRLGRKVR